MTTYSVRCRNSACRHRRVAKTHPDEYKVVPRCTRCGQRKGWRIEARAYNQRQLCHCSGPEVATGRHFPHRAHHPLCDHHPHGFYNQARARGVAHSEIPEEYRPMLVIEDAGMHCEDRHVLSSLLRDEIIKMPASQQAEFLAQIVEMLCEARVITPRQVGNLVYRTLSEDTEEADG